MTCLSVRSLNIHAAYGCQRTGACCSADWPVHVESDCHNGLAAALGTKRLRPASGTPGDAIHPAHSAATTGVSGVLARDQRRCVFLEHGASCTCRVQEALGHAALPLACRQFPRVSVRDPRGVSLTLSHFCPTATSMLEAAHGVSIVVNPPAFPAGGEYDGLDAARAMPPLLRPDLLMDWDAWWDWERLAVDLLASEESLPTSMAPGSLALGRLSVAVEALRRWRPEEGPLGGRVRTVMDEVRRLDASPFAPDAEEGYRRIKEIVDATPPAFAAAHRGTLEHGGTPTSAQAARGFLAAHAFANWHVQLGQGLRTWLRSLEGAATLLAAGVGVRHADLWLRHLTDVNALAKSLSRAEQAP